MKSRALGWCFLIACAPAEPLALPDPPPGTHTLILALDTPGCESGFCNFARVYRDAVVDDALTLPTGAHRLYALYYSSTLEELMIPAGELQTCAPTCARGSRRLPEPESIKSADIRGSNLEAFISQTELPDAIAGLELPRIDPIACASSKPPRCFQERGELPADPAEAERALRCIECPEPSPRNAIEPPGAPANVEGAVFDCPDEWREQTIDTARICRPHEPARLTCPSGQVQFFGETECMELGAICPTAGDFPLSPPLNAVFVRAGSVGDGTEELPFGTIDEALAVAGPGASIVLAAGTYPLCGLFDHTIAGACAAQVTLDATFCPGRFLDLDGRTGLRDVSIEGTLHMGQTAETMVESVRIDGGGGGCFLVRERATVAANRLVVSDCLDAVHVWDARANLDKVIVEDGAIGVGIFEQAEVSIANLFVRNAEYPVLFRDTRTATLAGAWIEAREHAGILVEGSRAILRDVYTRTTSAAREQLPALQVVQGSTVVVERAHFRDSLGSAVVFDANDGQKIAARLSDVVISEVDPADTPGYGIHALGRTEIQLEQVLIEAFEKQGFVHTGPGGELNVNGLVILPGGRTPKYGLSFHTMNASLNRVFITGTATAAISVSGSVARLQNVTLVELPDSGIVLVNRSTVIGSRLRFERTYRVGVYLERESGLDLLDVVARDLGTLMSGEGELHLTRAEVFNASAVFFGNVATVLTLRDVALHSVGKMGPSVRMLGGTLDVERLTSIGHENGVIVTRALSDLSMSHVAIAGGASQDPAIELTGSPLVTSSASFSFMHVVGGVSAIKVCGVPARLSDVHLSAAVIGLDISGTELEMQRFLIDDVEVGIVWNSSCVGSTSIFAQNGRVRARQVALAIPEDFDLSTALYNVTYEAPMVVDLIPIE